MGNRAVKVLNFEVVEGNNGSAPADSRTRRFGVFELDLRAGELRRNGMKVKLQEQPFQVLVQLLEQPGEVVTREDLRNHLWPADTFVDFDHSLNAAIKRLRNALGDSAENPTFVETVARRGYRFLAPVTTPLPAGHGALVVAPSSSESSAALPALPAKHSHLWWILAGVTAIVLLLVGLKLGFYLAQRPSTSAPLRITRLTANPADDRVRASAISRDGKYLAFSDETGFYLRQIDSGETHSVTLPPGLRAASLSWFPDSVHMMAALTGPGQPSSLWQLSALGGNPRRLLDDGRLPSVSPDGKQIAFISGKKREEQIWVMGTDGDGSQARKLVGQEGDFFGSLAWLPDNSKIAYTRRTFSYSFGVKGVVELVDVGNLHVTSLLQASTLGWFNSLEGPLAWISDGHLIYTLTEPPPRQMDSNLWSVGMDRNGHPTSPPVRLTNDAGSVISINTAGDGKRVAYLKGVPQPDVYVAKLDVHNAVATPRRLTLDDRQDVPFDWTADGKAVIFISDRTGTFNLYRQDIDQPLPELLVGGSHPIMIPRLSPDGTQLLYLVYPDWSDKTPTTSLMRMPLAGGAPQKVIDADLISNQQCARAPATLCLYSTFSGGDFTLFSFDPLQGKGAEIYRIKSAVPEAYNWSLSPDGATLAIGRGKQGDEDPRIHLISIKTRAETWVTITGAAGVASLDWAADSKSLWGASLGDEENTLLNIDLQGHARPVWHPKKMSVGWAIASRDGHQLALHAASSSANVWMLERP